MKDIYIVTRSQWAGNRYETQPVYAFERFISAQIYVDSMKSKFKDYEYDIEIIEVIEK